MSYKPLFTVTPHLLRMIEEVAAVRERILGATVQVSWMPALRLEARVRNTHSSTAIEGNPLTLDEVRELAAGRPLATASERSRQEVLNYFAGLRYLETHASRGAVSVSNILRLHRIISAGAIDQGVPGLFRKMAVTVGHYRPPEAKDVPRLVEEMVDWWNGPSASWSPVISSSILHYHFEEIHPFADGNGRTGRALALWDLYRRGFDTQHIFTVDEFYWDHRPQYYRALAAVQAERGDMTGWLEFCAEGLHLTLEKMWLRAQRMAAQLSGKPVVLRPKQEVLLHMLGERRAMTPSEIWEALGISKQGALDLLKPLMAAGLVQRVGTRKSGRYLLASDVTV
jgi:Fic family protein